MSREVSYDVYVKIGVDSLGQDEYGDAIAHFMEERNALAYKRQLEAQGETVHVEKATVHGLDSEITRELWFRDYNWCDS